MDRVAIYAMARSGHHAIADWLRDNWLRPMSPINKENCVERDESCKYHVLIVRDPFNWFASWWVSAKRWGGTQPDRVTDIVAKYKTHCREALGQQDTLKAKVILYNRWFTDEQYRQEIADFFEMPSIHQSFEKVPDAGGGSTFEGTSFDGKAQQMKVLERWKAARKDEGYLKRIDGEMRRYGRDLFGMDVKF